MRKTIITYLIIITLLSSIPTIYAITDNSDYKPLLGKNFRVWGTANWGADYYGLIKFVYMEDGYFSKDAYFLGKHMESDLRNDLVIIIGSVEIPPSEYGQWEYDTNKVNGNVICAKPLYALSWVIPH